MTCICKPEASIPIGDRIEYFVPIKGKNTYKLVELHNKKCEEHGIKDLTPAPEPAKTTDIVVTEKETEHDKPNLEASSDAENTSSS
jgi:hypothetical protein